MSLISRFKNILEAAQGNVQEQKLSTVEIINMAYNGPEDEIINNKGVDGYFDMLRDAKVSADIDGVVSMAIPGVTVNPPDDSEKAIRNADFMRDILTAMVGSTLESIRTPFRNAIITGLSVSEPQFETMALPNWGTVIGVTALNLKPTKSFTNAMNGIKIDRFGNILEFKQDGAHGGNIALPEDVVYYAFRGDANNRYGTSLLYSVYDPWKNKQKIARIYALFMATNASGIREVKLPNTIGKKATTEADLVKAQARMSRLATAQTLATMKDWDTKIHTPGSGTGGHFKEMLEYQDRQIDTGIYGDSAFSAQDQGSYASRSVSQSNVQSRMRAWGDAYMENFTEQFCKMVLDANGFDGPIPKIEAELIEDSGSRIEKYKVLGDLKQKGVIPIAIGDAGLKQIMQDLGVAIDATETDAQGETAVSLNGAQITAGQGIVEGVTAGTVAPGSAIPLLVALGIPQKTAQAMVDAASAQLKPVEPVKPVVNASDIIHAKAPSGRDIATMKRNGKQYDKALEDGAEDLSDTWLSIVPGIMRKIDSQLFDSKTNGWKTQQLNKIRTIAMESVRYKSSEMRKSMNATLKAGHDLGDKHAQAMIPVEAGAGFTAAATIQSLQNRTYLILEQKYPKVAGDIYFMLENAVKGDLAPEAVRTQISNYLIEQSVFKRGLVNTILDTSLSSAYNDARMSLFRQADNIVGYIFSAVMDSYTTDICSELDGKAFKADDPSLPQPPLHYNCRSQLIPIFAGEEPWTTESNGEYMSLKDSKAVMATGQASGAINEGFGGL